MDWGGPNIRNEWPVGTRTGGSKSVVTGQRYVGETGQPLHRGINSHRYDITHQRTDESPVAKDFNMRQALIGRHDCHGHRPNMES